MSLLSFVTMIAISKLMWLLKTSEYNSATFVAVIMKQIVLNHFDFAHHNTIQISCLMVCFRQDGCFYEHDTGKAQSIRGFDESHRNN